MLVIHRYLGFYSSGPSPVLFTGPVLIIGPVLFTGPVLIISPVLFTGHVLIIGPVLFTGPDFFRIRSHLLHRSHYTLHHEFGPDSFYWSHLLI